MSNPHVVNCSRPDAMSERELDVLSRIYRMAIERYEEANAAEESGGDDARKEVSLNGSGKSIVR